MWFPNQERIAYVSCNGNCEIFMMNSDGQNPQNLTNNPSWDFFPVVSPDGSKMIFLSDRSGQTKIYIMDSINSDVRKLGDDSFEVYYFPTWSPDGTRIAFAGDTDGDRINDTIFMMDITTGNFGKLTTGISSPQWRLKPLK